MTMLFLAALSAATSDTSGTRTLLLFLMILAILLIVAGGVIALFTWIRQHKARSDALASMPVESERR